MHSKIVVETQTLSLDYKEIEGEGSKSSKAEAGAKDETAEGRVSGSRVRGRMQVAL